LDCTQYEFDLLRVRRTSIMSINLFCCGTLIEGDEAMQKVVACGVIVASALVIREVVTEWGPWQFFSKEIDLVEEQNDGCFDEPS